jgi:hypothetical protein
MRLWRGLRSTPEFAVLLAEGPLEECVDEEIAGQDADADEYVERHDWGIVGLGRWGSPEQIVRECLAVREGFVRAGREEEAGARGGKRTPNSKPEQQRQNLSNNVKTRTATSKPAPSDC